MPEPTAFVEVPFNCPLPTFCPICGSPGVKAIRARAWEGIPFIFTYHVSVKIPYCRRHYDQLASLEFRQRMALWGIFILPFISALPSLLDWSYVWFFYVGCVFSFVCLSLAIHYAKLSRAARGVRIRTMGNWPAYGVRSFRPEWNDAVAALVEQSNNSK